MVDLVFGIEGYVKNEGTDAYFKLQRPLPPGSKLTFANAYATLGKKSGKDGQEFLEWLRDNYFPSRDGWVFYAADGSPYFQETAVVKPAKKVVKKPSTKAGEGSPTDEPGRGAGKVMRRVSNNQKIRGSDVTAELMVGSEYSTAERLIDTCNSKRELKKALALSRQVANKEAHMRRIHSRLQQV